MRGRHWGAAIAFIWIVVAFVLAGCSLRSASEGVPPEGLDEAKRICRVVNEHEAGSEERAAALDSCCSACSTRLASAAKLADAHLEHTFRVRVLTFVGSLFFGLLLAGIGHKVLEGAPRMPERTLWLASLGLIALGSAAGIGIGAMVEGTDSLAGLRRADIMIRQLHVQGALETNGGMGIGCVHPIESSSKAIRRMCAPQVADYNGFERKFEPMLSKDPANASYELAVAERAKDMVALLKAGNRRFEQAEANPNVVPLTEMGIYEKNPYLGKVAFSRLWLLAGWIFNGWVWVGAGAFGVGALLRAGYLYARKRA